MVTGIRDVEPPTIYLQGESFLSITQGSTFEDPGAEVEDNIDSPQAAEVFGTVNTQEIGTYTLTYTAMDEAGNKATPVTRIVEVVAPIDTTPPVLTLLGELLSSCFQALMRSRTRVPQLWTMWMESWWLRCWVNVQWDLEGFYALTYTAQDSAGNKATPVVRVIMITSSAIEETPNQTLSARQDRSEELGRAASPRVNDLRILRHDSGYWVIQWSGGGTLTHARTLTESFTPVPDATSPYRIPENQLGFFRLTTEGTQPLQ